MSSSFAIPDDPETAKKIAEIVMKEFDYEIQWRLEDLSTIKDRICHAEDLLRELNECTGYAGTPPSLESEESNRQETKPNGTGPSRKIKKTSNRKLAAVGELFARSVSGTYVKLICPSCNRTRFSSKLGFVNHCRILHQLKFATYEDASTHCGYIVDESQVPINDPCRTESMVFTPQQRYLKDYPKFSKRQKIEDTRYFPFLHSSNKNSDDEGSVIDTNDIKLNHISRTPTPPPPLPMPFSLSRSASNAVAVSNPAQEVSRFYVKKRIFVGNTSKFQQPDPAKDSSDKATHKWMVYVRGVEEEPDISYFVKKVRFFLDPSFKPNDIVEVSESPFQITRKGWGEFPVRVQMFFHDEKQKPCNIIHQLKLDMSLSGLQKFGGETVSDIELNKEFFEKEEIKQLLSKHSGEKKTTSTNMDVPKPAPASTSGKTVPSAPNSKYPEKFLERFLTEAIEKFPLFMKREFQYVPMSVVHPNGPPASLALNPPISIPNANVPPPITPLPRKIMQNPTTPVPSKNLLVMPQQTLIKMVSNGPTPNPGPTMSLPNAVVVHNPTNSPLPNSTMTPQTVSLVSPSGTPIQFQTVPHQGKTMLIPVKSSPMLMGAPVKGTVQYFSKIPAKQTPMTVTGVVPTKGTLPSSGGQPVSPVPIRTTPVTFVQVPIKQMIGGAQANGTFTFANGQNGQTILLSANGQPIQYKLITTTGALGTKQVLSGMPMAVSGSGIPTNTPLPNSTLQTVYVTSTGTPGTPGQPGQYILTTSPMNASTAHSSASTPVSIQLASPSTPITSATVSSLPQTPTTPASTTTPTAATPATPLTPATPITVVVQQANSSSVTTTPVATTTVTAVATTTPILSATPTAVTNVATTSTTTTTPVLVSTSTLPATPSTPGGSGATILPSTPSTPAVSGTVTLPSTPSTPILNMQSTPGTPVTVLVQSAPSTPLSTPATPSTPVNKPVILPASVLQPLPHAHISLPKATVQPATPHEVTPSTASSMDQKPILPASLLDKNSEKNNLVPVPTFQHYTPAENMEEYNLWSYHKKRMIEWRRAKAIAKFVKDKAKITDLTTKAVILWLRSNGHHPLPPCPTHLVVTPSMPTKPGPLKPDPTPMAVPSTPVPSLDVSSPETVKVKEEPGLEPPPTAPTPKSPSKVKRKPQAAILLTEKPEKSEKSEKSEKKENSKPKSKKPKQTHPAPPKPASSTPAPVASKAAPKKKVQIPQVKCEFCAHVHAPEEDCQLDEAPHPEVSKMEEETNSPQEEDLEDSSLSHHGFLESRDAVQASFFEKEEEEIDILGDFDSNLLY